MSLVKRLWIAVGLIILAAVMTAGIINIHSAQHYLENELKVKNLDTATALALTISQSASDPMKVELLLSSQFDLGHYQRIEYLGPDGRLLAQRERATQPSTVPSWFMRLFPITPEPGNAVIQSGWRQLGSIQLRSDPSFAYDSLWRSALELAQLFILGGIVLGALGVVAIRRVLRPLDHVVEQAEALAERRYLEVPPPRTLEFRRIIEAMNRLSQKTKRMLDDEAARLDRLKTEQEIDAGSGFMVREVFCRNAMAEIEREDTHLQGVLLVVRIANLQELNREIGRLQTDRLIRLAAAQIRSALGQDQGVYFGRLNASDFGLLLPGVDDAGAVQPRLHAAILQAEQAPLLRLCYGSARYGVGSRLSDLLSTCDQTLTPAGGETVAMPADTAPTSLRSAREWSDILHTALRGHEFQLALHPVHDRHGTPLYADAVPRIHSSVCAEVLVAGAFLPQARRFGLVGQVDVEILALAVAEIQRSNQVICVDLGYESVCDKALTDRILALISQHKLPAERLQFDVDESVAFEHLAAFTRFCEQLRPLGCRVGIERLDHHVGHLGRLHGLGLHSVKLSRAVVQGALQDPAAQTLLRGLCSIGHAMGVQVIADGIARAEDATLLFELGFDGVNALPTA